MSNYECLCHPQSKLQKYYMLSHCTLAWDKRFRKIFLIFNREDINRDSSSFVMLMPVILKGKFAVEALQNKFGEIGGLHGFSW